MTTLSRKTRGEPIAPGPKLSFANSVAAGSERRRDHHIDEPNPLGNRDRGPAPNLFEELIAARGVVFLPFIQQFRRIGVPDRAIRMCGAAKVGRRHGGLWEPDTDGEPALVVPVEEDGHLVDLVAVFGLRRWSLRVGAGVLLGHGWVDWQFIMPTEPTPIWRSPLGWLRHGGEGICVIGPWQVARQQLAWLGGPFLAEDVAHARELEKRLATIPKILVRAERTAP